MPQVCVSVPCAHLCTLMHVWLPPADCGLEHGNVSAWCSPSSQSQLKAVSFQGQPPSKTEASQAWHDPAIATWHRYHGQNLSLPPHPRPPPPSPWLPRLFLLLSDNESAASAKNLLPSALVEACLSVCLSQQRTHLLTHWFAQAQTHTDAVPHFLYSKVTPCILSLVFLSSSVTLRLSVTSTSPHPHHRQPELPTVLSMDLLFLTAEYKHTAFA